MIKRSCIWIFGSLFVFASICKDTGHFLSMLKSIEDACGSDRWLHFYVGLFFFIITEISYSDKLTTGSRKLAALLILSLVLFLDEFKQLFFTTRIFTMNDWLSGVSGLVVGFLCVNIYNFKFVIRNSLFQP